MKFTKEQIEKAKAAKSVEELLTLAKENGIELTEEEAAKYFTEWHKEGEIADEELDNVAGGCGTPDPKYEAGQRIRYNCGSYNGEPYSADKFGTIESASYSDYQKAWYYTILFDNGVREEYPLESELSIYLVL